MQVAAVLIFVCSLQVSVNAQQSVSELNTKTSAIVQQAKSQMVILANKLLTNASLIAQSADGNASLLLANLYNEINKGIAEAQLKVTQIGNTFQANFSKRAEELMGKAAEIYTKVQLELRKSTNQVQETIGQILGNSESEINKALKIAKAVPASTTTHQTNPSQEPTASTAAP